MKRKFCIVISFLLSFCATAKAQEVEYPDLGRFFEGFRGTFVILDVGQNKHIRYNKEQGEKRLTPCSTFKILNSLIGVETGV